MELSRYHVLSHELNRFTEVDLDFFYCFFFLSIFQFHHLILDWFENLAS